VGFENDLKTRQWFQTKHRSIFHKLRGLYS